MRGIWPKLTPCVALVLLALMLTGVARAEWWRDGNDAGTSALPVRLGLHELHAALKWNEISVPPAALLAAHLRYADAMEAALTESLPSVLQTVQGSRMSNGMHLSEAECARLRAHQKRMGAAADTAEESLFDELAATTGLDDPARERLAALRARRALDRDIEKIQRRWILTGDDFHVPLEVGQQLGALSWKLPADERARMSAALDARLEARRKEWQLAEPAIDQALERTLAAQREMPPQRGNGYSMPPVVQISSATRAALLRVELDTVRAVAAAASPGIRLRILSTIPRENFVNPDEETLATELPPIGSGRQMSVPYFAISLLAMPRWDDAARAKIRPIVSKWVSEDVKLKQAAWDEQVDDLTTPAVDAEARRERKRRVPARVQLMRTTLAELAKTLDAEWLKPKGEPPTSHDKPTELPDEDWNALGLSPPAPKDAAAPARTPSFGMNRWRETLSMVPMGWTEQERNDLLARLQLTDAQRLVAEQLFSDAAQEWNTTVEPVAAELRALNNRIMVAGSTDEDLHVRVMKEFVALQPRRREAHAAAQALNAKVYDGLKSALGPTAAEGQAMVDAFRLARVRDLAVNGCQRIALSQNAQASHNVIALALEMRASAEERALLIKAIGANAPDFLASETQAFNDALSIQDAGEAAELAITESQPSHTDGETQPKESPSTRDAASASLKAVDTRISAWKAKARATNDAMLARCAELLPPELVDRWRRAARIYAASVSLSWPDEVRKNVLHSVQQLAPESTAVVDLVFAQSLDPWEAWAETVVNRIDSDAQGGTEEPGLGFNGPSRRRVAAMELLLCAQLSERMEQALLKCALQLPADVAVRIPRVRDFASP